MDPRWLWLLIGPALLGWAAPVSAHPNHGPSWGERYLKLDATAAGVRVVYGLTVSVRFSQQLRAAADTNRDGAVTEAEAATYGRGFAERLAKNVALEVDGEPRDEAWAPPFTAGLVGPAARGPIAVETSASIELAPGMHRVTLDDRAEFDGIYRTTAKIMAAHGITLGRSGKGPAPQARDLRLVFLDLPEDGPPPPRIITLELSMPGSVGLGGYLWVVVPVGAGVVVAATIAVALWRRRRRRLTGPGTDTGR